MAAPIRALTTVGIDVGGRRKGFHAVALRDGRHVGQLASRDVNVLAHWCREAMGAGLIAIDAPCRWRAEGGPPRLGERELLRRGIRCFVSPTRRQALEHPSDWYGWMLQGEALYQTLAASHPLLSGLSPDGPACFETFPHAITWHLRGGEATAADKRRQRTELLQLAGLDPTPLTSIDLIDAALCALTAQKLAAGAACHAYGDSASGLIVVPEAAGATP